jgi:hypothetical protein
MEGGCTRNLFREWDLLQLGFTTNDLPPSESRRWYLRISDEALFDEGRLEYFRIIYQGQTYESQDHPEIKDKQVVWAWIPSRGVPSLPDLTVRDVSFSPQTVSQGGSITVSWTEINVGSGNAGPYRVGIYLGVSEYGRDLLLGSFNRDGLTAGGSRSYMQTFTIPSDVPAGSYYVTVFIDDLRAVSEANDENNIGSSAPQRIIVEEEEYILKREYDLMESPMLYKLFIGIRGSGRPKVHGKWDYNLEIEIRDKLTNRVVDNPTGFTPIIRSGIFYIYADRRFGPNFYPYGAAGEDPIGWSVRFYTVGSNGLAWYGLYKFPNLRNQALITAETVLTIGAETIAKVIFGTVVGNPLIDVFINWLLEVFRLTQRPPAPPSIFDPNLHTSWPLPLLYVDRLGVLGYHNGLSLSLSMLESKPSISGAM